jgi:hypothetical protein
MKSAQGAWRRGSEGYTTEHGSKRSTSALPGVGWGSWICNAQEGGGERTGSYTWVDEGDLGGKICTRGGCNGKGRELLIQARHTRPYGAGGQLGCVNGGRVHVGAQKAVPPRSWPGAGLRSSMRQQHRRQLSRLLRLLSSLRGAAKWRPNQALAVLGELAKEPCSKGMVIAGQRAGCEH